MESKVCIKCGIEKPVTEFSRDRKIKDGYMNTCKVCNRIEQRTGKSLPLAEKRYCCICGEDISHLHWKRLVCENPECAQVRENSLQAKRREQIRSWYKRNKERQRKVQGQQSTRTCRLCKKPIRNSNYFFCDECHQKVSNCSFRFDGDWLFGY